MSNLSGIFVRPAWSNLSGISVRSIRSNLSVIFQRPARSNLSGISVSSIRSYLFVISVRPNIGLIYLVYRVDLLGLIYLCPNLMKSPKTGFN